MNQRQSDSWPYGLELRGHNPRKKESVMTVVACTLGKVRNWDTVNDSAQRKPRESYATNTQG